MPWARTSFAEVSAADLRWSRRSGASASELACSGGCNEHHGRRDGGERRHGGAVTQTARAWPRRGLATVPGLSLPAASVGVAVGGHLARLFLGLCGAGVDVIRVDLGPKACAHAAGSLHGVRVVVAALAHAGGEGQLGCRTSRPRSAGSRRRGPRRPPRCTPRRPCRTRPCRTVRCRGSLQVRLHRLRLPVRSKPAFIMQSSMFCRQSTIELSKSVVSSARHPGRLPGQQAVRPSRRNAPAAAARALTAVRRRVRVGEVEVMFVIFRLVVRRGQVTTLRSSPASSRLREGKGPRLPFL